jgi:uncharacterized protein (TIGR02453 family)
MAFTGWPAEALDFFDGLEADNTKTYWTEHRAVYDNAVLAPMAALLADLEDEFGPGKIFRPYRDVRFSNDKTPYKTNIAARVGDTAYLELTVDGLGGGRGMWEMASDQLDRYRRAVDSEKTGRALEKLVTTLERKDIVVSAHGQLKTAPRGYPKDHPRIDLLRQKGIVAWRQWPVAPWLGTATAKRRVVEFLRAAGPLTEWLAANVGATDLPEDARRRH